MVNSKVYYGKNWPLTFFPSSVYNFSSETSEAYEVTFHSPMQEIIISRETTVNK